MPIPITLHTVAVAVEWIVGLGLFGALCAMLALAAFVHPPMR